MSERPKSDPTLLDAYRKQCAHAVRVGSSPGLIYMMWRGQQGVTEDDLLDILKEFDHPDSSEAPRMSSQPCGLTEDERAVVRKLGEVWNDLCRIVGDGRTRDPDLVEACAHVHALQHAVMSQAAARAHPGEFRLLGRSILLEHTTSEAPA